MRGGGQSKSAIRLFFCIWLMKCYWISSLLLYLSFPAEKANENFYTNRRHLADLAAKGTLPMHSVSLEQEPTNPYSPELPCQKQNGHKSKSTKVHSSHPLAFGSNTIANPGMLKNWEVTETLGRRQTHGPRKHSATVEQVNELTSAHSQHYLPPHPYFVTNSKTEVTVWTGPQHRVYRAQAWVDAWNEDNKGSLIEEEEVWIRTQSCWKDWPNGLVWDLHGCMCAVCLWAVVHGTGMHWTSA